MILGPDLTAGASLSREPARVGAVDLRPAARPPRRRRGGRSAGEPSVREAGSPAHAAGRATRP